MGRHLIGRSSGVHLSASGLRNVHHPVRPERFGGESDGDTVHLMTTKHVYAADRKTIDHAELWHAYFDLPVRR